ncbi:MAG: iron chelate uptake ABC transporter family permease subunit [Sporichthyaceae bacterium]
MRQITEASLADERRLQPLPHRPRRDLRAATVCLVLGILLSASAVVTVGFGSERLAVDTVAGVLRANILGGTVDPTDQAIVWDLRVPRMLMAIAVGAGLAIAGMVTQTLVRNPLADPYVLGISSGASPEAERGSHRPIRPRPARPPELTSMEVRRCTSSTST